VLFCKRNLYLVLLYTTNLSRGVNTNCHSPLHCSLPFTSVGILCRVCRTTRCHTKDRNTSAEHLEQFV
jgi:hypothetical protein